DGVRQHRDRREDEPLQRRVMLEEIAIRNETAADEIGRAKEFDLVPVQRMQPENIDETNGDGSERRRDHDPNGARRAHRASASSGTSMSSNRSHPLKSKCHHSDGSGSKPFRISTSRSRSRLARTSGVTSAKSCRARAVKSSYGVGIGSSRPVARSISVTSTAAPRLCREPFAGSATKSGFLIGSHIRSVTRYGR